MNDSYVLLAITSDTIVGLATGSFEELSKSKSEYESIADSTGVKLKIEGISGELEAIALSDTNKIMEIYGYLLGEEA